MGRVDELSEKRKVYDSNKLVAAKTKGIKFSPYLHQIPCRFDACLRKGLVVVVVAVAVVIDVW